MSKADIQALLQEAITAAKAVQKEQSQDNSNSRIRRLGPAKKNKQERARAMLLRVIDLDETNIPAWLWLSTVVDDLEDKQICLENVLTIDPHNKPATAGLAHLKKQMALAEVASTKTVSPQQRPHQQSSPAVHTDKTIRPAKPAGAKPSPKKQGQPPCPYCRQPISGLATNCPHCAIPLIIDCPVCDQRFDIEQAVCPHCYYQLGDFRQGGDYFAQLAKAHWKETRPQKALVAWEVVKALTPDYPHIDLRLGKLEAEVGRTDAAINHLHQAMKQAADELAATLELGKIFQELHRWDDAGLLFRKALKLAPEQAETQFAMGWFLMEQGQLGDALPYLRQAVKIDPKHGQAWLRLAQLYDHIKNPKQAARAYQRATILLSRSSLDNLKAQQRLTVLQPDLPLRIGSNSGELVRQMSGPVLLCLLAALMDAGLRPWWFSLLNWLALFLALPGAFLWVSGASLPRNPLMLQLMSEQELSSATVRLTLAIIGALFWLLALGLILLPVGQTLPEAPSL